MSNYSKSTGPTYTTVTNVHGKRKLTRGLRVRGKQHNISAESPDENESLAVEISTFFQQDHKLVMRQTVAVLDKIVRKPRSFWGLDQETYKHRTLLGAALWRTLLRRWSQNGNKVPNESDLKQIWNAKVHPYAQKKSNYFFNKKKQAFDFGKDENIKLLEKRDNKKPDKKARPSAEHPRWRHAFWITDRNGQPDYQKIADRIINDLTTGEIKIHTNSEGKIILRFRTDGSEKKISRGRAENRGDAIAASVSDPREVKASNDHTDNDLKKYCYSDPAKKIFDELEKTRLTIQTYWATKKNERGGPPPRLDRTLAGRILYDHFGGLDGVKNWKDASEGIKNLHNQVRGHYKKLLKQDRLKIALRECREGELYKYAPKDWAALIKEMGSKNRNSDMMDFVRLGRMIVHSSKLNAVDADQLNNRFKENMDHYVSSNGQSEIKRVETFARVWRNSIGLSQRTLTAWFDPKNMNGDTLGDVFSNNRRGSILEKLFDDHGVLDTNFSKMANVLFGKKSVGIDESDTTRSSLFMPENKEEVGSLVKGYLSLGAYIRNRTHHFMTREELLSAVTLSQQDRNLTSDAAFKNLLNFDISLRKSSLATELNQIGAPEFLRPEQRAQICAEIGKDNGALEITTPKFMGLLNEIKNIALGDPDALDPLLKPFSKLDLKNYSTQPYNANKCTVELLRRFYASGFDAWLGDETSQPHVLEAIERVTEAAKNRSLNYQQDEQKRAYVLEETWLDNISAVDCQSLQAFSNALSAQSASDGKTVHNYKPVKDTQKERSNQVEKNRRQVFADLFAQWLKIDGLDWVFELDDNKLQNGKDFTADEIKLGDYSARDWHKYFYAWLYLLPSDDVSLLRHQFKKSSALEKKSEIDTDTDTTNILAQLDQLMGLYTKVNTAGFDGTEHVVSDSFKNRLYEYVEFPDDEGKKLYDKIMSGEIEDQYVAIPGTRRGLRNVIRFGHEGVLDKPYRNHAVTLAEVQNYLNTENKTIEVLQASRTALHKEIMEQSKKRGFDKKEMAKIADKYCEAACTLNKHNFNMRSLRLTDHANTHHLMMKVVGRLVDYTLLWERDSQFVFLGMLYRQYGGEQVDVIGDENGDIAVKFGEKEIKIWEKKSKYYKYNQIKFSSKNNLLVWLNEENKKYFERYFLQAPSQHPYNVEGNKRRRSGNEKQTERKDFYKKTRKDIRNHFVHYNVITSGWSNKGANAKLTPRGRGTDLTYLVNAVRSLMSYDRKLKNAVSKSIAKILADEGLYIQWDMIEDRLKNARVSPMLIPHLTMLDHTLPASTFSLPKASVRYTSMVQTLFEQGNEGHRKEKVQKVNGQIMNTHLEYPHIGIWDPNNTVPTDALYNIWYRPKSA